MAHIETASRSSSALPPTASPATPVSLYDHVTNEPAAARFFFDRGAALRFTDLARGTSLGGRAGELAGRSVLLATASQLTTALALIELDGCVRRMTVLPPGVAPEHLGGVIAAAEIDAVVTDAGTPPSPAFAGLVQVDCAAQIIVPRDGVLASRRLSEWVLLTSGTTGAPKLVRHDLASLSAPIAAASVADGAAVWGTFYDIRRYGGLQIYLRALLGGASLVLSNTGVSVGDHLARLGRRGVTNLSGTPSHWRRALIDPAIGKIAPRYIRLSGEIADQAVLDALRAAFPRANIGHAYASTEAGVAFDVNDGLAGFPAAYIGATRHGVEIRIGEDGSLRIRSPRAASCYLGNNQPLADAEGFIDTGDIVQRRDDRYYFVGRKGGIINIGGLKVHPEEVEAVINRHPRVRMSLVRPRKSPVTGAIVVADVVLKSPPDQHAGDIGLKDDILKHCREALPRHKVPAAISFVASLKVEATGKLTRRHG
jgi:non-ribosomal peptide synthetase component F